MKISNQVSASCLPTKLESKPSLALLAALVLLHHIPTREEEAERKALLIIFLKNCLHCLATSTQYGKSVLESVEIFLLDCVLMFFPQLRVHAGQQKVRNVPSRATTVCQLPVNNHPLASAFFLFVKQVIEMKVPMQKTFQRVITQSISLLAKLL